MSKQIVATFQSRDAADSVKDAFIKEGFAPHDLIIMTNRDTPEPPEDAKLEVGNQGEGGLAGVEEKIGKTVLSLFGKKEPIEGDGFEGEGKSGALLAITLQHDAEEARVRALLERHFAGDIEVAQPD